MAVALGGDDAGLECGDRVVAAIERRERFGVAPPAVALVVVVLEVYGVVRGGIGERAGLHELVGEAEASEGVGRMRLDHRAEGGSAVGHGGVG